MRNLSKLTLAVLSTLAVSSVFAQCPGNGPCPKQQGGYGRGYSNSSQPRGYNNANYNYNRNNSYEAQEYDYQSHDQSNGYSQQGQAIRPAPGQRVIYENQPPKDAVLGHDGAYYHKENLPSQGHDMNDQQGYNQANGYHNAPDAAGDVNAVNSTTTTAPTQTESAK